MRVGQERLLVSKVFIPRISEISIPAEVGQNPIGYPIGTPGFPGPSSGHLTSVGQAHLKTQPQKVQPSQFPTSEPPKQVPHWNQPHLRAFLPCPPPERLPPQTSSNTSTSRSIPTQAPGSEVLCSPSLSFEDFILFLPAMPRFHCPLQPNASDPNRLSEDRFLLGVVQLGITGGRRGRCAAADVAHDQVLKAGPWGGRRKFEGLGGLGVCY